MLVLANPVPDLSGGHFHIPTYINDLLNPSGNEKGLQTYNFDPFTPSSDQDRISPYNINTISSRQVMSK